MALQLEGRVLVTGGAGFIGRAIMQQAAVDQWDCEFIVYSRDEYKQALCRRRFPDAHYILGDIRDADRLEIAMMDVDVVVHAAALKYVPQAETNVSECISINVGGTQAILDAARRADRGSGDLHVVCISTDKAVEPVNVYGMTKAITERLVKERSDNLRCVSVRYGNVIGSTGSVIPEIQYRLAANLPVQVTDPHMTRFWMPATDAVDLICFAAGSDVWTGSVVVKAAEAMNLGLLVSILAGDKVQVVGARPGERLHETLMTVEESRFALEWGDDRYEVRSIGPHHEPLKGIWEGGITSDTAPRMTGEAMLLYIKQAATI